MMLQMYVLMFAQHQIEATIFTHILRIFVAKVHIDRQHAIMCLTTSIITYSYVSPFVKFACDGIVHARSLSRQEEKFTRKRISHSFSGDFSATDFFVFLKHSLTYSFSGVHAWC